jgi:hypothetical protein
MSFFGRTMESRGNIFRCSQMTASASFRAASDGFSLLTRSIFRRSLLTASASFREANDGFSLLTRSIFRRSLLSRSK